MNVISSASLLWIIPILALSIGLSYFFYSKNTWLKEQTKWLQRTLPFLRFISLLGSLILLLDLIFIFTSRKEERPVLVTVIDNSSSMLSSKDSTQVKVKTNEFIQSLKERFDEEYDLAFYSIGSEFKNLDNLSFNEEKSNHELAFTAISDQYFNRNLGAVVFVSDGNYNTGNVPTYAAEQISLSPIFTLGVGDVSPKKDQAIKQLYYNDIVFLNDEFPIEVDIESYKIQNRKVRLSLSSNGKEIASKTIQYGSQNYSFIQETFTLTAKKVGIQAYKLSIEVIEGEYSKSNNSKTCYIEVIDSRNEILLVSNSPHPDISAVRSVIESNENYHATFATTKEVLQKKSKADLVIWYDPNNQYDEKFQSYLEQNKLPVFYFIGPNTSNQVLAKLKVLNLGNSRNQSDETQGYFNSGFNAFEVSEEVRNQIDYYPPLLTKFGSVNPITGAEIMVYQRMGQIKKNEPLVFFGKKKDNIPIGVVYGEGVWRWKMQDFLKHGNHDIFNELFSKSINYLLIKREGMGLTVQFDKRFSKHDLIGVNANFYNASIEPIISPVLTMTLKDKKGKKFISQFSVNGKGYALDLGKLQPGEYSWTVNTSFNKKKYAKGGVFVVEDISLEKNSNFSNHGVLKLLAKNSNGNFTTLPNYKRTLDSIAKRDDISIIESMESTFQNLIDSWMILIILITSLSGEWFLRRYYGAY